MYKCAIPGNLVAEVFFHEMPNVSDNEISNYVITPYTISPSPPHPPPQEYMCMIVIVMKS